MKIMYSPLPSGSFDFIFFFAKKNLVADLVEFSRNFPLDLRRLRNCPVCRALFLQYAPIPYNTVLSHGERKLDSSTIYNVQERSRVPDVMNGPIYFFCFLLLYLPADGKGETGASGR